MRGASDGLFRRCIDLDLANPAAPGALFSCNLWLHDSLIAEMDPVDAERAREERKVRAALTLDPRAVQPD
jgi:hypothetical protein